MGCKRCCGICQLSLRKRQHLVYVLLSFHFLFPADITAVIARTLVAILNDEAILRAKLSAKDDGS